MATKLNQIIAVEKGVKSRAVSELTTHHHQLQKPALLSGIARTYQPRDEDGEVFPPESTKVQLRAGDVIKDTVETLRGDFRMADGGVASRSGSRPAS